MIDVRRSDDRYPGGDAEAGIATRHAFSFGGFYDPDNLRFGPLMACNEESLAAGAGFEEHPHSHTEIVTWVVEGELTHRDSAGHATVLRPGDVQRLSSASGVRHVERNDGARPLRFVQMWLAPVQPGGEPGYDVVRGLQDGVPYEVPGARAVLHVARPAAGERVPVPAAPRVYVHVVAGELELAGGADGPAERLAPGDSVRITGAEGLAVLARTPGELLLWELV
ncbi:pirin family protein [Streptomyces bambusae]|uniref:pirin family protein n=1 Tax=Streptomyces bambusae TaxID=1550616 RepID=UPI001CFCE1B7|nr:pirin family protein [Streptomyces bambusae]MCB5164874.1 pirin family protein [Streptomyces bambusae]